MSSWRLLGRSLLTAAPHSHAHTNNMTTLIIGGGLVYFAGLAFGYFPILSRWTPAPEVAMVEALLPLILGSRAQALSHPRGIFRTHDTIAEHVYRIDDRVTGTARTLAADDTVIDLHIDLRGLRNRMKGVPRLDVPARFAEELRGALPKLAAHLETRVQETGAKAVRMITYLNPALFPELTPYAVNEFRLSDRDRGKPSAAGRFYCKILRAFETTVPDQLFTNLFFRPFRKWLKVYPETTYLVLADELPRLKAAFETPSSG